MSTDHPETPASVTIVALGYRARCNEAGCKNLGRMFLRYADAGGRPMSNSEFCLAHARLKLAPIARPGSRFTTMASSRGASGGMKSERAAPLCEIRDLFGLLGIFRRWGISSRASLVAAYERNSIEVL